MQARRMPPLSHRPAPQADRSRSSAAPALKAVLAALLVGAEGLDEAALTLSDEDRLAVVASEGEVGRLLGSQRDLPLHRAIGLHQRDRALEDARNIQAA